MNFKTFSLGIVCFFVLVLTLACQSSERRSSEATSLPAQFRTPANSFVFINGAEPETLDPHRVTAHDAAKLSMQLFEGLLSRGRNYLEVRPGLAESWSVSEDGREYRFQLRSNAKWSNGEPIEAEQVYRSFLRAMNPEVSNYYVAWYTDFIVGAREFYEAYGSPQHEALRSRLGIELNGNELLIRLVKPVAYFEYLISKSPFAIIHPNLFDPQSRAWTQPKDLISNGAYRLREWRVNDRVVLEKNENYYEADQVSLERIVALPINDFNASWNLYHTGEVDWMGHNTIAPQRVPQLEGRADFFNLPMLATYSYIFNLKKEPFQDQRVREAFALVIQQEHITERLIRAGHMASHLWVPPVIEGYSTKVPPLAPHAERVERAQSLLAEAGFPGGRGLPPITLKYNTNESHARIAQAVQQMWREHLGVSVRLENMEWKVYLSEQNQGNFQVSRFAWIGDYPDPSTFLELFQSQNENNRTGWSHPEYDRLVSEAASTLDSQKRHELQAQAEKIMLSEWPMVGIYHYAYYSLMNPEIEGFEPNIHGHYLFRFFSKNRVDSSARLN